MPAEFVRVLPGGHLVISDQRGLIPGIGLPVVKAGPHGSPGYVPIRSRLTSEYLAAALPLGLQVRRCEEPRRPFPLVDDDDMRSATGDVFPRPLALRRRPRRRFLVVRAARASWPPADGAAAEAMGQFQAVGKALFAEGGGSLSDSLRAEAVALCLFRTSDQLPGVRPLPPPGPHD